MEGFCFASHVTSLLISQSTLRHSRNGNKTDNSSFSVQLKKFIAPFALINRTRASDPSTFLQGSRPVRGSWFFTLIDSAFRLQYLPLAMALKTTSSHSPQKAFHWTQNAKTQRWGWKTQPFLACEFGVKGENNGLTLVQSCNFTFCVRCGTFSSIFTPLLAELDVATVNPHVLCVKF